MSPDQELTTPQLIAWRKTSLQWVAKEFGGEDNIIAGAFNHDERTPHLHVFVVPIDPKKHLNCRHYLGARSKLQTLQTSYADAVAPFGLRRGRQGSKRKHIPQRILYEFRNDIQNKFDTLKRQLDTQLRNLDDPGVVRWQLDRKAILNDFSQTLTDLREQLEPLAELAKDSLLARRDAAERGKLLRATTDAQTHTDTAATEAANQKLRADQALKEQAALVRGLDLVPLAQEILGLSPTEKDGVFSFTDATTNLQITGRRFKDPLNPDCKGTGAIDLVTKLTGRNFKAAVEYLITRHSPAEIAADQAGATLVRGQDYIRETAPQPRIITIEDVPKRLWPPRPDHWSRLLYRLTTQHHLDGQLLRSLHNQKAIWAVSPSTLAVARSPIGADDPAAAPTGVTLLDLDDPLLRPRILAPSQPAAFWLGIPCSKAQNIIVAANPLEALSYRQICTQFPNDLAAYDSPHILSADAPLPPVQLVEQIDSARQRLVLATHAQVTPADLTKTLPKLVRRNRFVDWFTLHEAEPDLAEESRAGAWNRKLLALAMAPSHRERVLVRSR